MKITKTVELTNKEKETIQDFLKMVDEISDAAKCPMGTVISYFANEAACSERGYTIGMLHLLDDIGG